MKTVFARRSRSNLVDKAKIMRLLRLRLATTDVDKAVIANEVKQSQRLGNDDLPTISDVT